MAKHDDRSDLVKEHGPWAGVGYLQDLEVSGNEICSGRNMKNELVDKGLQGFLLGTKGGK